MSIPTRSIWVGQVELTKGLEIFPVLRPPGVSDNAARIWVRRNGVPLGHCEVPIEDGVPDIEVLRRSVASQFAPSGDLDHGPDGPKRAVLDDAKVTSNDQGSQPTVSEGELDPITVVVATKGRPELAGHSIASLRELDHPAFEVILIDGSIDTQTAVAFDRIVGDDARFRYVSEHRPGLSLARNIGMSQAQHDLVAFTDDDCRVDPLWLRSLNRGFASDPRVACVTGMVPSSDLRTASQQYFDSRVWWSSFFTARTYTFEPIAGDPPLYPFQVGMFGTGANFAVRRSVAIEIGWFSELLGGGGPCPGSGEDQDMFIRILRSGHYLTYEPSAIVWHEGRATDADLKIQLQAYSQGMVVNGLKWLLDPSMRGDVLRRLPRAGVYFLGMLREKGQDDPAYGGSMAWAEAIAIPTGVAAFLSGYRIWRKQESEFDARPRRTAARASR
jgi:GT2 family glycosyltransferase